MVTGSPSLAPGAREALLPDRCDTSLVGRVGGHGGGAGALVFLVTFALYVLEEWVSVGRVGCFVRRSFGSACRASFSKRFLVVLG